MRLVMNYRGRYEDVHESYDIIKEFENNVNMYFSNEHIDLTIIFDRHIIREVVSQFGKDIEVKKVDVIKQLENYLARRNKDKITNRRKYFNRI